jgi:DNA excision repair protein ERCC-4
MASLLNTHPHSTLPSYLSEAFSDLYAQDGLVVLGQGLGWLGLLCSFVRFYADTSDDGYAATIDEDKMEYSKCQRKPPLVFVLNLRDEERSVLLSTLSSWGTPPEELPRIITNEAGQSTERSALYARGGVFIVTSRILIVDLLQGTAQARDIEGLLVAHAERVVGEKSVEAFILRIFRSQKYFISVSSTTKEETDPAGNNKCGTRGGFIKAFSDDASSLVSGSFAKVEKVLKSLQVPRLFLYPRFHASVAEELERNPPNVIELHQPLSESMKSIQNYLAASIRSCLRDLRQKSTLVDLSFLFDAGNRKRKRKSDSIDMFGLANNRTKRTKEEGMNDWKFTIQQCIATNFSFILSRQLEGDWHRLSWDVKQCISDLRTLSQLFHHLIEYGECLSELFHGKSD